MFDLGINTLPYYLKTTYVKFILNLSDERKISGEKQNFSTFGLQFEINYTQSDLPEMKSSSPMLMTFLTLTSCIQRQRSYKR